jgi:hypothetical protein
MPRYYIFANVRPFLIFHHLDISGLVACDTYQQLIIDLNIGIDRRDMTAAVRSADTFKS